MSPSISRCRQNLQFPPCRRHAQPLGHTTVTDEERHEGTDVACRVRLGRPNHPVDSKVVRDAIDVKLVKLHGDDSQSKRDRSYMPYWA